MISIRQHNSSTTKFSGTQRMNINSWL